MYAIVDIAGAQFKLTKGDRIRAPKLDLEVGQNTQFTKVLLWSRDDGVSIGQPVLEDVAVSAKVLAHGRDDKVVVFKMKRRKGYRRKHGHRQGYTELLIEDIVRPERRPPIAAKPPAKKKARAAASSKTAKAAGPKKTPARAAKKAQTAQKKATQTRRKASSSS